MEAHYDDDEYKNRLCATVPLSDAVEEFPLTNLANMINESRWRKESVLRSWIIQSRLDGFGKVVAAVREDDVEKQAILTKIRENARPAIANLQKLAAEYDVAAKAISA